MKKIISIILLMTFISACNVLEENPLTILTPGGFYKTKQGMEALINSCYAQLREVTAEREYLFQISEQGTDIFEAGSDGNIIYDTYAISTTDSRIRDLWDACYKGINGCNYVTKYINEVDGFSNELKKIREAEARFLRAYMYYHLVMQFGEVHLSLDATEGVEVNANRTPINQIFDVIHDDLDFAISNLPVKQSDYGRIDVWGAKLFKSKVILSDSRSIKTDFEKAAEFAVSVINDSGYELLKDRFSVFDENNPMNKEIIWSIQFPIDEALVSRGNQTHAYFVPKYDSNIPGLERVIKYHRPYTRLKPTQFMLDLYDESVDSRYDKYWLTTWYAVLNVPARGMSIGDTALHIPKTAWSKEQIDEKNFRVINPEFSNNLGSAYFRVTNRLYPALNKFHDTKRTSATDMRGTRDWIVFRTAEAYLLASEAFYKATDMTNAVKYMNILRRTCAKPGKESSMEITISELDIDFILDERARELCGEQHRWYDLKRTNKLFERAKAHNQRVKDNIKEFHILRPIPQTQIDRTQNEYQQNPGW